jgi:hypothetical protein
VLVPQSANGERDFKRLLVGKIRFYGTAKTSIPYFSFSPLAWERGGGEG